MLLANPGQARKLFCELWDLVPVNQDGGVPYPQFFRIDDYMPLINEELKINHVILPTERIDILYRSFLHLKRGNINSFERFIESIKEEVSKILRKPLVKYFIMSTISFDRTKDGVHFSKKIGESRLTVGSHYPRLLAFDAWFLNGFGDVNQNVPENYARIWASTRARTEEQAANQMLRDIELYMSVYNITYGSRRGITIGRRSPLNSVRLGPVQILHDSVGKVIKDIVYYEPEFTVQNSPHIIDDNQARIQRYVSIFINCLERNALRNLLKASMRQYSYALNLNDPRISLVGLWSCLEILTGTTGDKADDTARRGAFLSHDYDYRLAKLRHVSRVRNSFVHAGTQITMVDHIVLDLKSYLAELIRKLVLNPRAFRSESEFLQMLSLPADLPSLRSRTKVARLGIKMRGL